MAISVDETERGSRVGLVTVVSKSRRSLPAPPDGQSSGQPDDDKHDQQLPHPELLTPLQLEEQKGGDHRCEKGRGQDPAHCWISPRKRSGRRLGLRRLIDGWLERAESGVGMAPGENPDIRGIEVEGRGGPSDVARRGLRRRPGHTHLSNACSNSAYAPKTRPPRVITVRRRGDHADRGDRSDRLNRSGASSTGGAPDRIASPTLARRLRPPLRPGGSTSRSRCRPPVGLGSPRPRRDFRGLGDESVCDRSHETGHRANTRTPTSAPRGSFACAPGGGSLFGSEDHYQGTDHSGDDDEPGED